MSTLRTAAGLAEAWATALVLAIAHLTHPLRERARARRRQPPALRRVWATTPTPGVRVPFGHGIARRHRPRFSTLTPKDQAALTAEPAEPFSWHTDPEPLPPLPQEARAELDEWKARGRRVAAHTAQVRARESLAKDLGRVRHGRRIDY